MTQIQLVRTELLDLVKAANDAHPGLLIQRGWTDFVETNSDNKGEGGKSGHIVRICKITAPDLYRHAFERWFAATHDAARFRHLAMKVQGRLLIGLSGGGALETGCAVSQTYGMPYIPGSSLKGAARAWAKQHQIEHDVMHYLFGTDPDAKNPEGLSGEIVFHDAWWIPDSGGAGSHKNRPFAEDVVTTHHGDYYGSEGATPATDLDNPTPNALIGVRGSFLFTLEGEAIWLKLAEFTLRKALENNGIGAKTAAGYGYLLKDSDRVVEYEKIFARKQSENSFIKARLTLKVNTGEIFATLPTNKVTVSIKGEKAKDLMKNISEEMRNGKKIKEGKLEVEIRIKEQGNMIEIIEIRQATAC